MATYTTIDDPTEYFNTVLRSGLYGGSDTAFTVGFQPDWIWDKRRSDTSVHALFDSVRGFGASGKVIYSNTNGGQADNALIKSVNSTGFTITASSDNTGTLVDWCWKAGTSFSNDASSTSVGSIDSAGTVSTEAGFSIIQFSGTGSLGTVAHGLGAIPNVIFFKRLDANGAWASYHETLGATKYMRLDSSSGQITASDEFNDTEPTSTVFTVQTDGGVNASGTDNMIAYCFAEKQGYSKFSSYTGNGNADGTFVYTGFRPAWVLCKTSSINGEDWIVSDNKRNLFNETTTALFPNSASGDQSSNSIDMLSNGFKMRTTGTYRNQSGVTYIYMAFAEAPLVNSNGVPNNAR
jgi:hypothetical protein